MGKHGNGEKTQDEGAVSCVNETSSLGRRERWQSRGERLAGMLFAILLVDSLSVEPVLTQPAQGVFLCDDEWTYYMGHCYYINTINSDYSQSRAYCAQYNGYLADIQSAAENSFIYNLSLGHIDRAWIGYNDISREGAFVWDHTRQNESGYENWEKDEPNDKYRNEDCGEILIGSFSWADGVGVWNDLNCQTEIPSVCKTDANECLGGIHGCHQDALCTNTEGSYSCACNKTFTGNGKNCTKTTCSELRTPQNGTKSNESAVVESVVTFKCNSGYALIGESALQCLISGEWNGTAPNCSATEHNQCIYEDYFECVDLMPVSEVHECKNNVDDCHENATCTNTEGSYFCKCKKAFTGDGKNCSMITCGNLPMPENGRKSTVAQFVGTIVRFDCSSGYYLSGSSTSACKEDGQWNATTPHCREVNECLEGTHDCHENATCVNNDGSYMCACNQTFTGDGKNCSSVEDLFDPLVKAANLVSEQPTMYAAQITEQTLVVVVNLTRNNQTISQRTIESVGLILIRVVQANTSDQEAYGRVASSTIQIVGRIESVSSTSKAITTSPTSRKRILEAIEIVGSRSPILRGNVTADGTSVMTSHITSFSQTVADISSDTIERANFYVEKENTLPGAANFSIIVDSSSRPSQQLLSLSEDVFHLATRSYVSRTSVSCSIRVQVNLFTEGRLFTVPQGADLTSIGLKAELNSWVTGVKINEFDKIELSSVAITLKFQTHTAVTNGVNHHVCVFWDFAANDGDGGWSTDGCSRGETSEPRQVICRCNHLTNFAVLLAPTVNESKALTLASVVAMSLSMAGLLLTALVHLLVRQLRLDTQSRIVIGLCINLFMLNFVIVVGAERTSQQELCQAVAIAMHYFLLSSFGWMTVEAYHLYLKVIKVFNSNVVHFVRKAILATQGVPVILVSITAGVASGDYGDNNYCRLSVGLPFYLLLVLPISVAMIFSYLTYGALQYQLLKRRKNSEKKHNSRQLKTSVSLASLIGLTWASGLLLLINSSVVTQWIFVVLVATQGTSLFFFQVVTHRNLKKIIRHHFSAWKDKKIISSDSALFGVPRLSQSIINVTGLSISDSSALLKHRHSSSTPAMSVSTVSEDLTNEKMTHNSFIAEIDLLRTHVKENPQTVDMG